MLTVFDNQDKDYLRWVEAHGSGYVLNVLRSRSGSGMRLHSAACWTIRNPSMRGRGWTSGEYIKVGADVKSELIDWAHREVGSAPLHCGKCLGGDLPLEPRLARPRSLSQPDDKSQASIDPRHVEDLESLIEEIKAQLLMMNREIEEAQQRFDVVKERLGDLFAALAGGDEPMPHVDEEGLVAWISEQTDISRDSVSRVLDLEFEHMVAVGIIDVPEFAFRYYDRQNDSGGTGLVNIDELAIDAERFLDIPREVALAIFSAELRFLQMRGLA